MTEFWISFVASLAVGIILFAIEHWIIEPRKRRQDKRASTIRRISINGSTEEIESKAGISEEFIELYYKLAVGLLGVLSGVTVSILLRLLAADYGSANAHGMLANIASGVADSDFLFFIMLFVSAIGGGLASVAADFVASKSSISFLLRLITAIIFGFVGGALSFIIVILGIVALFAYAVITEERRQSSEDSKL